MRSAVQSRHHIEGQFDNALHHETEEYQKQHEGELESVKNRFAGHREHRLLPFDVDCGTMAPAVGAVGSTGGRLAEDFGSIKSRRQRQPDIGSVNNPEPLVPAFAMNGAG
jgi:hypothetical protein